MAKRTKPRRGYLKRFSSTVLKTKTTIDRLRPDYRGGSTRSFGYVDQRNEGWFGPRIVEAREIPHPHHASHERRMVVEAIHQLWQSNFSQKVEEWNRIRLIPDPKFKGEYTGPVLWAYFKSNLWRFLQEEPLANGIHVRISIEYDGRDSMWDTFQNRPIKWTVFKLVPTPAEE